MDHDHACETYLRLAVLSHKKQQIQGRDRFIVLAIDEAVRAGLLRIGEQLRTVILSSQPHHLLSRFQTLTGAVQNEDWKSLLKQVRRLCNTEKAEAIVQDQSVVQDKTDGMETERRPHRVLLESLVAQLENSPSS